MKKTKKYLAVLLCLVCGCIVYYAYCYYAPPQMRQPFEVPEPDDTLRIAYIGEQGDTLAYLVEGIGFDSRDMGDLLTPFTRYPEADCGDCFQEYCGLSHVVKDGKIIYKGMLYREGLTVGIDDYLPCDVNGDGSVNITDADNVIVIIINGGNGHDRQNEDDSIVGDVNGDGVVNITDLNHIINTIITKN